ncbi:MAG: hypothetical protein ACFFEN_13120 [Candidatus Thorarchaeota archaeon]
MEQFQVEKPEIFNKIQQAWSLARPIKAPYNDVKKFLIKSSEIGNILEEKERDIEFGLTPGGIYSIFSEKTQYGMGKSQLAHFLRLMYENSTPRGLSDYFIFDPSEEGFLNFKDRVRDCFNKCSNDTKFYFFIDEIDLISDPEITEEVKYRRIERFGNILIKTSEEAYYRELPFYFFLVLSKRILNDFELLAPHRIRRRIKPFLRADIPLDKNDIEKFAINFFALLWASNYKNIQIKLREYHYKFKDIMGNLLTHLIENLDSLGLDIQSTVVGDLVERLRNIFEIIFDGINDDHLKTINLVNASNVGKELEGILKIYLRTKNRPLVIHENGNKITVNYRDEEKFINGHKSDGYYDFRIGDNEIGFMPVEITAQKNVHKGRKKKQLRAFTDKHISLLIWIFSDKDIVKTELEQFDEEVKYGLVRILLPRDLIQYILIVEDRAFSLLEEFRKDIMGNIETFLRKYSKILFNRWMIGQPIEVPPQEERPEVGGESERTVNLADLEDRVSRVLENVFQYLEGASKRRNSGMKTRLEEELKRLAIPLQNLGIEITLFESNTIYREIAQALKDAGLCRYNSLENNNYLVKEDIFTVAKAVSKCKDVIMSRIKDNI